MSIDWLFSVFATWLGDGHGNIVGPLDCLGQHRLATVKGSIDHAHADGRRFAIDCRYNAEFNAVKDRRSKETYI